MKLLSFMRQEIDPSEYHRDLLTTAHDAKKTALDQTGEKLQSQDEWEVFQAKSAIEGQVRQSLQFAIWSEEFYRARLLRHGRYHMSERGEMIDDRTGLSTQQLADMARLKDYCTYSVDAVLEILPTLHIPAEQFQIEKVKKWSTETLWNELAYEYGEDLIKRAPVRIEFAQKFGLEKMLKDKVEEILEANIKRGNRQYAEALIHAYGIFFERGEVKKRWTARFYPLREGLQKKGEPDALFGEVVEGEGETVSLDKLVGVLKENVKFLAEDIAKQPYFYFDLKNCLRYGRRPMGYGFGNIRMFRDEEKEYTQKDGRNYCKVVLYLGGSLENYIKDANPYHAPRLEFHYSCDNEDIQSEGIDLSNHIFTTTKNIRFEGAYFSNEKISRMIDDERGESFTVRIDEQQTEEEMEVLQRFQATKQSLLEFSRIVLAPEKDLSDVFAQLDPLKEKLGLDEEAFEELKTAIREFRIYTYTKRRSDVGDCMIDSPRFRHFCEGKFGLPVTTARYGEKHPEWGDCMGYEGYTFMHIVNVVGGRVVVDWTVTQYGDQGDKPIPYIYEIGAARQRFGTLYKNNSKKRNEKDPNEPFLDGDPLDKRVVYDADDDLDIMTPADWAELEEHD